MPIAFPPPERGAFFNRPSLMFSARALYYIPAPNMDAPGKAFVAFQCDLGKQNKNINFRELGRTYRNPALTAVVNPANASFSNQPLTDRRAFDRGLNPTRWVISGVSRDDAGVALGLCRVMLFSTFNNSFLVEVTSDASGNWSFYVTQGWPFFLVEYLAGSPDRAGTSKNNLAPGVA